MNPTTASDKCGVESECLSFDQYVAAAKDLWMKQSSRSNAVRTTSIVVTSESKQILGEQANYTNHDNISFPLRFVSNRQDITQNTGYLEDVLDPSNASSFSADQAMLSAIASLKLQLLTRTTIGNCCSNFHLLLKDLLDLGCGATVENTFQCLQDHENLAYRVCCAWDKSAVCQARRQT